MRVCHCWRSIVRLGKILLRLQQFGALHLLRLEPAFAVDRVPAEIPGDGQKNGRRQQSAEAIFQGAEQDGSFMTGTNQPHREFCLTRLGFASIFVKYPYDFNAIFSTATILPWFHPQLAIVGHHMRAMLKEDTR